MVTFFRGNVLTAAAQCRRALNDWATSGTAKLLWRYSIVLWKRVFWNALALHTFWRKTKHGFETFRRESEKKGKKKRDAIIFEKKIGPAPLRSLSLCLLTTWYWELLSAPPPPVSFFFLFFLFFCRGKFVFRLHKIAFSYFERQCMRWKISHIIYP